MISTYSFEMLMTLEGRKFAACGDWFQGFLNDIGVKMPQKMSHRVSRRFGIISSDYCYARPVVMTIMGVEFDVLITRMKQGRIDSHTVEVLKLRCPKDSTLASIYYANV